eukprot:gene19262-21190_t
MSSKVVFLVFSCSLAAMSTVFNCLGIYLLLQIRTNNSNQTSILTNLSLAEIIIAIGWLAEHTCMSYGYVYSDRPVQVVWALRAGAYCFWFTDMWIMAVDRCIGCSYPLKHRVLMNRVDINLLLKIIWLLCALNTVFLLFVNTHTYYLVYNRIVWLIFDCISVAVFIVAYGLIFFHIIKRRKRVLNLCRTVLHIQHMAAQRNQQFLKIVGLITVTFMIFEVCPTIVTMIYFHSGIGIPDPLASILDLSYVLALFVDPLIYIFLQARVRKLLMHKFNCCLLRNRHKSPDPFDHVVVISSLDAARGSMPNCLQNGIEDTRF